VEVDVGIGVREVKWREKVGGIRVIGVEGENGREEATRRRVASLT
jgi:hypothetical protein